MPLVLKKCDLQLSLLTMVSTLGKPLDVTLQQLRIESYLPADAASHSALQRSSEG